jgi:hypothetical protein
MLAHRIVQIVGIPFSHALALMQHALVSSVVFASSCR